MRFKPTTKAAEECTRAGREHLCIPYRHWLILSRWRCVTCDRIFRWDAR